MKLVSTICPQCGAQLNIDPNAKEAHCQYCGATLLIDDEVARVEYTNAEAAGYDFEKGRLRAQAEANQAAWAAAAAAQTPAEQPRKRRTWLWVLGWLIIFPVPATILLNRNRTLSAPVRYALIALVWIIYFAIGFSGKGKQG